MDDADFFPPLGASWHILVTKKSQVHALNELLREMPGPMSLTLHADGLMRRIATGIWASNRDFQQCKRAKKEKNLALQGFFPFPLWRSTDYAAVR